MKLSIILICLTLVGITSTQALAADGAAERKDEAPVKDSCAASYPQGDPNPLVAICEGRHTLEFRRGEERRIYSKEQIKKELQDLLANWLGETAFPSSALCQAELSLWISVPESNPLASQLRLEVNNSHMPFVVYLAWDHKLWKVDQDNTAILPEKGYPDSFGYRSGNILVKRHPDVSQRRLDAYLVRFGLHSPTNFSQVWSSYRSEPFAELESLAELHGDLFFSSHLENATLNPVVEWIASRVKAFTFTWPCQPPQGSDEAG